MLEKLESLLTDLDIQVKDNDGNYRLFNEIIEELSLKLDEIYK